MGTEIERKYLVNKDLWLNEKPNRTVLIQQAYLVIEPEIVVRVRISEKKGYITFKSKTVGITRKEFEYEIPLEEADQLIQTFAKNIIEKKRHFIFHDRNIWMVDEFLGMNEGLITAEIELKSPDDQFNNPKWLGEEISFDFRYSNANLSTKPYQTW